MTAGIQGLALCELTRRVTAWREVTDWEMAELRPSATGDGGQAAVSLTFAMALDM